jgi:hypothetical protein
VHASEDRLWQLPENDLEKGRIVDDGSGFLKQHGLHVVLDNNAFRCCQEQQCAAGFDTTARARAAEA